jgi:glutaredoxin
MSKKNNKNTSKRELHFEISGIKGCPYYISAIETLSHYKNNNKDKKVKLTIKELTGDKWDTHVEQVSTTHVKTNKIKGRLHKTSPYIICNGKFIGGFDSILAELKTAYPFAKY